MHLEARLSNCIQYNYLMNKKTTVTLAALAAVTTSAFAANSVTDGARALANGTVNAGKSVVGGAATAGKGLLNAPGHMLKMGDDSLPKLSAGTREFALGGNINWGDDIDYNVDLAYGYFIQDNWMVGFNLKTQGKNSDINFGLGLSTEYNFVGDSKWVPFVGFSMNWAKLDSGALDASSIALGLDLGVKYFLRENLALSFSVGADYAFDDVFPGGDDFAKQINIGTRFYF